MPKFPLEPTRIHVSDEILDDLRARLTLTRPPLDEGNGDWFYGVPDSYLRELVAYWRDRYDWRKAEAAINAYEQYQVSVAGVPATHEENAAVHVSGHARAEELRTLLGLVRPKAVMPIHGEYRMQAAHARLAQDAGVPASSIVS